MPSPLTGDPRRVASDSIGGYVYQLWHSVFAWLTVDGEGFLYLEGAEDIDEHGRRKTQTSQVKREEENLTLNTKRAREVIENFWKLQLSNPDQDFEYRLISTSGIGKEQDDTFGDRRGIEVWNKPAKTAEDRRQMKAFLEKQEFNSPLKDFIKTASAEEIDEKLVRRLRWNMNQPQTSGVISAVERKLVILGEHYGVGPQDAKDVAPHLFAMVAGKASEKELPNRRLDRAALLELFYEKTHRRLTNEVFRQHEQLLQSAVSGLGNSSLQIATSTSLVFDQIPNSPIQLIPRESLLTQVTDLLQGHEIVLLQGSTGMGKTRMAAISTTGKSLVWVDLSAAPDQGLTGTEVRAVLDEVARRIDDHPDTELVVLDDLDLTPSVLSACRSSLEALLYTLQQNSTRLLITSQKALPPEFSALSGSASIATLSVPVFEDEEIEAILRQHGCPEEQLAAWRVHVSSVTAAHPQLVHARVKTLAAAGWPPLSLQTIFQVPQDVSQARRNAALLLNETRPDDLRLIYPLSLLTGRFRRDLAIRVGETIGTLPNAGDNFDRLVGPWIEPVGDGYYRLSPLLDAAASAAWTPEKVKTTREAVGQAIFYCDHLSLIEAGNVLFQAVAAQSELLFGQLIPGILALPEEGRKAFANYASWFVLVQVERLNSLAVGMQKMALTLQLTIAVEAKPESVMPVLEKIRSLCNSSDETDRMLRTWSEMQVYFAAKDISIRDAARLLVNYHEDKAIEWNDPEIRRLMLNARTALEGEQIGFDETLFAMLLQRVRNHHSLEELIAELRENSGLREIFTTGLVTTPTLANLMINGAWLGEEGKTAPAWEGVLTALRAAAAFAIEFSIQPAYEAAVRAIVVIQDEYLKDFNAAEATFVDALAQFPEPSPILLDGQATYLLNRARWAEALAIWERILPTLQHDPLAGDTIAVWGRRKAAIAAGELGRWDRCAELFADAINQIEGLDQVALRIGLQVDRANALWQGGKRQEAIAAFAEALIELMAAPVSLENLPLFKVQRCFGQSLINISKHKETALEGMIYKTPIGFCSDPAVSEKFKELGFTPTETLWTLLLDTEQGTDIPPGVKGRAGALLGLSALPYNRLKINEFFLQDALLHFTGNENGLLTLCQQFIVALGLVIRETKATGSVRAFTVTFDQFLPSSSNSDPATVAAVLDVVLTALIFSGADVSTVLNKWKAEAALLPLSGTFASWVGEVEKVLVLDEHDTAKLLFAGANVTQRFVAALRVCLNPSNRYLREVFCSHLLICDRLAAGPLYFIGAELLVKPVIDEWQARFANRAQFDMPNISIPLIQDAIKSQTSGLRKIVEIVLAARAAVQVTIPHDLEERLEALAKKPA